MKTRTTLRRRAGVLASGFLFYGVMASVTAHRAAGVPSTALDPVPDAMADSGSRLKAEYLLGDDGSKDYLLTMTPWLTPNTPNLDARPASVYWDSQRLEECAFDVAGDSVLRCLPVDYSWASWMGNTPTPTYFADASCTQPITSLPAASPGCPQLNPTYVVSYDYNTPCPITSGFAPAHYYPVGSFLGGNPQMCWSNNGGCVPVACGGGGLFYAVGPEIDPTSFVGSTAQKDP